MIKVSEFRKCQSDPPKKNGRYLVVGFSEWEWAGERVCYYGCVIEFLVGKGWNTGSSMKNKIDFSDEYSWAEVTDDGNSEGN